jgi:hypothetical protein
VRQDLRDEKDFVAMAGDRLPNPTFGVSVEIHLGGIDVGHAEIDSGDEGR